MRPLPLPSDATKSQGEIIRRLKIREQEGITAHIRAVIANIDDEWRPICGRIDISRQVDAPAFGARPVGNVRLLLETVPIATVIERLESGFNGEPFTVQGMAITGHGMNAPWQGGHHTDDWKNYGAQWPVFCLHPTNGVEKRAYLYEVIEAEGDVGAFDGSDACVRAVMGFRDAGGQGIDTRFGRFQIVEWDYRGAVRARLEEGSLRVQVNPANDANLKLAVIVRDQTKLKSATHPSPSSLNIPVDGGLARVNMTLRHEDNIVCEARWDAWEEAAILQLDGRVVRSPSAPEGIGEQSPTINSQIDFGFLVNPKLATMVTRDFEEIELASEAGACKAAVVMAGSVLEAALLDVLGRNEDEARKRLLKKWPDRASLRELIDTATSITILLPNESTCNLLPPLTAKKGAVVTDHRDLIHPRAKVRAAAPIDEHTVQAMRGILGEIIRDLRLAHERGVLDEYAAGNII